MKVKTDCNPKRFRKYHDKDDTHRTSRSLVATPDCNIDLNRIVNGKGSFTEEVGCQRTAHRDHISWWRTPRPTDYVSTEKCVDPAHDQRLRYNHSHVALHHPHHCLHPGRIGHWICRWLALVFLVFEERPRLIGRDQKVLSGLEGRRREHRSVIA